ncbi:hypothetical protein AB0F46_39090 [Streptomyces sp. NPDC026665]|uniref:hypothetical protein n=1 Tax=Streptomyces sp. NPDC026665 TaxID=3154798 RepID=UPI0033F1E2E8
MTEKATEEAMARALTERGYRTMTSETWSRQSALDALAEQRRRHPDHPRRRALDQLADVLADRLVEHAGVTPEDIATVLLIAGATVGALAVMHELPGVIASEILQVTAAELDRRGKAGEGT